MAQKKKNIDFKKLNGSWISVDDKKYRITIKGSIMQEYYGREKTAVLNFKVNKNMLTAIDNHTGDIFKYEIVILNNHQMSLIYLDRGNTLNFKRK
ncbi:MAG: hypothetical protein JWO92_167 [Chitinophagaceae bacterium]|nr:hypothetical protein [Chitinophagaceae bacterium]MDB5221517.1 hypothetical protein [Chitinophagaceae bacterium]